MGWAAADHAMAAFEGESTGSVPTESSNEATVEFPMGRVVGRYVLARKLGAGGMGTVYEAYDPDLGRRLALKFFHDPDGPSDDRRVLSQARENLVREAQAMAAVDHPNVISVYDVGMIGERVYVAMELVEGDNLRDWLRAEKRSLRTKLRVARDAAAGLAAVHARGLVHRDFKPDNLMVGKNGRVYVMDFGLAVREVASDNPSTQKGSVSGAQSNASDTTRLPPGHADVELEQPRGFSGTPAYMAPEQHLGRSTSPHSDQFAFCVTLYEMLYGRRPFAGRSTLALARAKSRGQIVIPSRPRVPKAVIQLLRKGLRVDHLSRFPDMSSLELILNAELHSNQGAGVLAACAAFAVAAVSWAGISEGADLETSCSEAQGVLELQRAWSPSVRRGVAVHFSNVGGARGGDIFDRVHRGIRERINTWVSVRSAVCGARSGGDSLGFDVSMSCLERRAADTRELISSLGDADAKTVENAVALVNGMPDVGVCGDPGQLQSLEPVPLDPRTRAKVRKVRQALDRVRSGARSPKHSDGSYTELLNDAEATNYAPAIAETHFVFGYRSIRKGRLTAGLEHLRLAVEFGTAHEHDVLVAKAMSWALFARVYGLRDDSAAHDTIDQLLAFSERIKGAELPRLTALEKLASVYSVLGDLERSETIARDVAEQYLRLLGPEHPTTGLALQNHGVSLALLGRLDAAERQLSRAVAVDSQVFGPLTPKLRLSLSNLSILAHSLGRDERAVAYAERGARIHMAAGLAADDVAIRIYRQYGVALISLGRYGEARRVLERLSELVVEIHGAGTHRSRSALPFLIDLAIETDDRIGLEQHCDALKAIVGSSIEDDSFLAHAPRDVAVLMLCAHHAGDHQEFDRLRPLFSAIDRKPPEESWAVAVGPRVRAMQVWLAAGRPSQALALANETLDGLAEDGVTSNPNHFPVYEQQARALLSLGASDDAQSSLKRALELAYIQLDVSNPRVASLHALSEEVERARSELQRAP